MTHHHFIHTILLGCTSVVIAGFARAEIVQYVDEAGTVTYTDALCQNGADAAPASVLTKASANRVKVSSPARTFAAAEKARDAAWLKKHTSNRSFAVDVATLKEARSSMLLKDQASSLLRQQKLAALDQRSQRWFNF